MLDLENNYARGVDKLFAGGRDKIYSKNQLIHYQGDPLSHIYLVTKGYIKGYTILDSGDTRTMFILSKGDIFPLAFSASLDWSNYKILYFYQSLTDCHVRVLTSGTFKDKLETDSEAMNSYLAFLSSTNEAIMNQLEIMKNKKAIEKVSMLLPYLIAKAGKKVKPDVYELQLKLSHQEIADISGVTRETTTTLIKELEKEKIIDQQQGKWLINTKNLTKYIPDRN